MASTTGLSNAKLRRFTPFEISSAGKDQPHVTVSGKGGRTFAAERASEGVNVFDAVVGHVKALQAKGKRVLISSWTNGARERLGTLLCEHGLDQIAKVESWPEARKLGKGETGFIVLGIEHGLGQIQLSPADAQRVWQWVEPSVPAGWPGMSQPGEKKTFVVVRK